MNYRMKRLGMLIALVVLGLTVSFTSGRALGVALTWDGGSGNWDTTSTQWNTGANAFTDGSVDTVDFGVSPGATDTIIVSVAMTPISTTVSAASGTYSFITGSIDAGPLSKSGASILDLQTAANGFTTIGLGGGEIHFTNANQLGSSSDLITVSENSTLDFFHAATGGTNVAKPMTVATGKVMTFTRNGGDPNPTYSGKISGDGALRIESTDGNQWNFSNSTNDFTGGVTVAGNARFTSDGALGTATTITVDSGRLIFAAAATGVGKTLNIVSNATFGTSGGLWKGLVVGAGQVRASNLGLDNAGNTMTSTFVNSGTIRVGVPGSLGTGSLGYTSNPNNHLILTDAVGGTYVNNLGMGSGANRQITVENAVAVIDWTGTISGTGDVVRKLGPGTFKTSSWTATNNINVEAGTLIFNDPTTTNVGTVTVSSGATLGGDGTLDLGSGDIVTINGMIAPGESAGQLTIAGSGNGLDMNATSSYLWELAALVDDIGGTPGTDFDQLVVSAGDVIIDAGATLDLSFGTGLGPDDGDAFWSEARTWTVLSFTSGGTSNDLFTSLVNGNFDQGTFSVANFGGNIQLNFAPTVPEPSSFLLLGLGALGLMRHTRRRRARA